MFDIKSTFNMTSLDEKFDSKKMEHLKAAKLLSIVFDLKICFHGVTKTNDMCSSEPDEIIGNGNLIVRIANKLEHYELITIRDEKPSKFNFNLNLLTKWKQSLNDKDIILKNMEDDITKSTLNANISVMSESKLDSFLQKHVGTAHQADPTPTLEVNLTIEEDLFKLPNIELNAIIDEKLLKLKNELLVKKEIYMICKEIDEKIKKVREDYQKQIDSIKLELKKIKQLKEDEEFARRLQELELELELE